MRPGPRLACFHLHNRIPIDAPPRDTADWLTEIVDEQKWTGEFTTARERAESWDKTFQNYLRIQISDFARLGRYSAFAFNSSADNQIQGAAYIEPADTETVKEEKIRRGRLSEYIKALRSFEPRELELLCAGILSIIKADSPRVTKYSADRGVDFFGKLRFATYFSPSDFFANWQRQLNAWVVGQAKHYVDGTVSTPALRDLAGTVTLLKGALADRRSYPTLVLKPCDPIFHILVTTGRLSNEVWKEIDRSGAVGIDGEMLASFIAAHNVAFEDDKFDPVTLRAWLLTFESVPILDAAEDTDSALNEPANDPEMPPTDAIEGSALIQ